MTSEHQLILRRLQAADTKLPTLSPVIARILSSLDSASADAQAIGRMVGEDVALVSRVLAVAHSSFYNPSGVPISSIRDAVARIGFDEVRQIVATIGVIEAFRDLPELFDTLGFWRHSLTTAIAADAVGARIDADLLGGRAGVGQMYLAGLLHDVGLLLLIRCQPRRAERVLAQALDGQGALELLERAAFGASHAEAGAALLTSWGLAGAVGAATCWHHAPARAPREARGVAEVTHLADWISAQQGFGFAAEGDLGLYREGVWHDLGLTLDRVPELIADFDRAAEQSELLLSLVKS